MNRGLSKLSSLSKGDLTAEESCEFQMVNKRVIVTISDDVELHRKRGDIDASNEAFQRLITMSQEVVHSSNGAVKTLQNPADSSFKVLISSELSLSNYNFDNLDLSTHRKNSPFWSNYVIVRELDCWVCFPSFLKLF